MKEIKINEKNITAIEEAIKEAQGKATERTITAQNIIEYAEKIRIDAQTYSSKKATVGMTAVIDKHAQRFARAYKYAPQSTQFQILCKATGWYLVDVYRATCHGSSSGECDIVLTEAQKADLLEYAKKHFIIY